MLEAIDVGRRAAVCLPRKRWRPQPVDAIRNAALRYHRLAKSSKFKYGYHMLESWTAGPGIPKTSFVRIT